MRGRLVRTATEQVSGLGWRRRVLAIRPFRALACEIGRRVDTASKMPVDQAPCESPSTPIQITAGATLL
jgi:hypothetical protein